MSVLRGGHAARPPPRVCRMKGSPAAQDTDGAASFRTLGAAPRDAVPGAGEAGFEAWPGEDPRPARQLGGTSGSENSRPGKISATRKGRPVPVQPERYGAEASWYAQQCKCGWKRLAHDNGTGRCAYGWCARFRPGRPGRLRMLLRKAVRVIPGGRGTP